LVVMGSCSERDEMMRDHDRKVGKGEWR